MIIKFPTQQEAREEIAEAKEYARQSCTIRGQQVSDHDVLRILKAQKRRCERAKRSNPRSSHVIWALAVNNLALELFHEEVQREEKRRQQLQG